MRFIPTKKIWVKGMVQRADAKTKIQILNQRKKKAASKRIELKMEKEIQGYQKFEKVLDRWFRRFPLKKMTSIPVNSIIMI